MAYNNRYNPDALPMHAEPDQAAAMLSPQPGGKPAKDDRYASKPQPNTPGPKSPSMHPPRDDRYGQGHGHRPTPSHGSNNYGGGGSNNYGSGAPPPRDYDRHDGRYGGYTSPPPSTYAYGGPPPPPGAHGRPPARPPPTPAPPRDGNDREALWRLFGAVDKDGSGQLTERELRGALVNGDYTGFDAHTRADDDSVADMLCRMFDTDKNGSINFDEFCGLWGFLAAWRNLFDRFDRDRSGNISYPEFSDALVSFGYRLSPAFVSLLFRTYDKRGENAISFDLFVQACISLKRMTDVFKKYDEDRDGYITLSFEEFLTGAQSLFLFNSISESTDIGWY